MEINYYHLQLHYLTRVSTTILSFSEAENNSLPSVSEDDKITKRASDSVIVSGSKYCVKYEYHQRFQKFHVI